MRLPLLLACCAAIGALAAPPSDSYTYAAGFLAAGDDLGGGPYTYADALAHCDALIECMGITFAGDDPKPASPVNVYFKSAVHFEAAPGWQTWEKVSALHATAIPVRTFSARWHPP